jgi:trimeric autotransporter adhesin
MTLPHFIRSHQALTSLAALALTIGAAQPAAAQDAAAGKALYNTRYGAQNQGCYSCHGIQGNTLSNISKIRNGVNNPAAIQSAINNNTGGMLYLKPYLSSANLVDIAAYLANPGLVGVGGAVASLSSSSLVFASTSVGSRSAAQTLTLRNTGTAALTLASLASSSAQFIVTGGSCATGTPVAAGASCTVTLVFSPTAGGAATGTLNLSHGAGSSAVALSGTGVATNPLASLSATSLGFSQVVGSAAAAQTVTLSNTGTAPLLLSGLAISGAAAADFSLGTGSCTSGSSVAAGSGCSLVLGFTPAAVGSRVAALAISHNAAGSPSTISLQGTGTAAPAPAVSLDATSLDFGNQALASTSAVRSVQLRNSGGAALQLAALTLGGAQAADFALGGSCSTGSPLPAGSSCSLQLRFTPGALGSRAGTLTLASDAPGGNRVINLAGTGTAAPAPAVALSAAAVDFGTLTVGAAAGTRSVTLSNTGSASLSLADISVSGTGFSGSHGCGSALAAGASCTLSLAFAPAGVGAFSGQARITSNAAGSPHSLVLNGAGALTTLPVLAWQGAAQDFGSVSVGSRSAAQTLTLLNQGPGAATLRSIAAQGTAASEFVLGGTCATGATLAANASCSVSLVFAPGQAGGRSATLDVQSNGSNPAALALVGTGVASVQARLGQSVTSLALPAVAANGTGTPLPVTLTNTGNAAVTLTALVLSNSQFTASAACGSLPVLLAPGQTCRIDVAANPAGAGSAGVLSATLTVATDTNGLAPQVALSGAINASRNGGDGDDDHGSDNEGGGGGCSAARPGAAFDPVLWLMSLAAAGVLWLRRRG